MTTGKEVSVAVFTFLFALCLASSAHAVVIDLGSYSVQDPRITVNYTADVFLLQASLINLDPGATIRDVRRSRRCAWSVCGTSISTEKRGSAS